MFLAVSDGIRQAYLRPNDANDGVSNYLFRDCHHHGGRFVLRKLTKSQGYLLEPPVYGNVLVGWEYVGWE